MSEISNPAELRYNRDHQWLKIEGDVARSGITHFGQDSLGDIVFVAFPQVGTKLAAGEKVLDIESTKVVWEIFMPLSGEVIEVNQVLDANPELVNQDPYGAGWILAIRFDDIAELDALLDSGDYRAILEAQ
jgi:glycine cleavage system H protein